jgi:eukaryotic-like serine/threonine-protein kinase
VVNVIDNGVADVWMVPTGAADKPRALLTGAFVERDARLSRDGRLVAYVSDATGSPEISVQTIDGPEQREVVSAGGGSQPAWSRNASELFFVDPKGLLSRTAVGRAANGRPVLGRAEPLSIPPLGTGHYGTQYDLSPDGRRIYFLDRRVDEAPRDIGIVLGWRALVGEPRQR